MEVMSQTEHTDDVVINASPLVSVAVLGRLNWCKSWIWYEVLSDWNNERNINIMEVSQTSFQGIQKIITIL